MKYNLLKMTQLILSSMDSDEVNGIDDTTESSQVVDIIETVYNDLRSTIDLPEHWDLFELDASGNPDKPTLMTLPDSVLQFDWLQYDMSESGDTIRDWKPVKHLPLRDFLDRMNALDTAEDNVYQFNHLVGAETFDVRGFNDQFPAYYATPDNRTLLFDNFRLDIDTTLVANKTQAYGKMFDTFTRTNTWVPDFDNQSFSMFFNECKATAFNDLKQAQNPKAEFRARKAKIESQRNKETTPQGYNFHNYPSFGRRSKYGTSNTKLREGS